MLIETITFEMRDFSTGNAETFLVDNTELNYAMIANHKTTRDIHFTQTFDFQFEREVSYPKFMQLGLAVADGVESELEFEDIDYVDEMVGSF